LLHPPEIRLGGKTWDTHGFGRPAPRKERTALGGRLGEQLEVGGAIRLPTCSGLRTDGLFTDPIKKTSWHGHFEGELWGKKGKGFESPPVRVLVGKV